MKQLFPSKLCKLLVLIISLTLVIAFTSCSREAESDTQESPSVIVSQDNLEVYKKTDTDSKIFGQLPLGLELVILEEKTVDEVRWGRIDTLKLPDGTKIKGGWIRLEHVRSPEDPDPDAAEPTLPPEETEPAAPPVPVTMGTVTAGKLNIREDAGSKFDSVGSYLRGDRIEILETKTVEDTVWGRTSRGWVGMGYVRMDGTAPEPDPDAESDKTSVMSDGNYTVLGYGVVDLQELNVRRGPGTEFGKLGTVTEAVRYAYYQLEDGWVRIEDGWVSEEYFYLEGTEADDAMFGTVTIDNLNIRTGPNTSFRSVGTHKKGDEVVILARVHRWGYTEQGWISMDYVEERVPDYTTGTGTVTIGLNIRKEPNADSETLGSYAKGDHVTITEVKDGWGKTDKGWINLKYVDYD